MSRLSFLVVFVAGGGGCVVRWLLGVLLNPLFPTVPMGTVAVNLAGGLLIGLSSAFFSHNTSLPPEWRLMIITGFLGGMTTFSTFSLEIVTLIGRREYLWGLAAAGLHVLGSLLLTALGILIVNMLFDRT
ncbi:MAG: fluoride efflux transporter CrcB [Xenophilus sp.]